jgi:predicted secreted protein
MAMKKLNPSWLAPSQHNPKRRMSIAWTLGSVLMSGSVNSVASNLSQLSPEGIELVFPRLADTGNAVPLEAQITAPSGTHLTQLKVVLPENPNPLALQLKILGQARQYQLSTRLRLAASQSVWVHASFSDGSERAHSAPTVITSTACLDDS